MTNSESAGGRRGAGLLAKLGLLLLWVAFSLALGEIALRILWHNPYAKEVPDHVLKLRMQHPHTDHWVDRSEFAPADPRVRFRTDGRGYIVPSRQYAKPDVTVVFLGGSTTACNAVQETARFPVVVGKLLTARGIETNSLNAARSGGTVHDSLNVLLNHVLFDSPDIVVLMHATNDIGIIASRWGYLSRSGHPVQSMLIAKWLFQLASSHSSLIGLARQSHLKTNVVQGFAHVFDKNDPAEPALPTAPFEDRLRAFVRLARSFDVEPVLMTQPLASSRNALTPAWADLGNQDRFNHVIREVARTEDALLIDLVRHLQEEVPGWDEPMKLFYDGMHVNDDGSRVYAAHIADQLYPMAREIAARRTAAPAREGDFHRSVFAR